MKYAIFHNVTFLYLSTSDNIYFKKYGDTKLNTANITGDDFSGAGPQNFDINNTRNILTSTPNSFLINEFENNDGMKAYNKHITKIFEKPIRFIQFFKKYYVFALYDENNKSTLCIYDPINNIFLTLDESFKQKEILSIISSEERIYILLRDIKSKDIICLKEIEDKKKFDIFYEKNFYDLAYSCAKNWGFDREQLAEIAKSYADFLYLKEEFDKSIVQYKLTINYLDPTFVIEKFLDDNKKNYLIKYLEELLKLTSKEKSLKYTNLLLNCYIKQKKIKKLKDFVDKQDIKDKTSIKIAIELCKETNNTELALSFAERAKKEKLDDIYIQILISIPKDYKDYQKYMMEIVKYLTEMKDIKNKYQIIIDFGKALLEKKEIKNKIDEVISNLVDIIINIKLGKIKDEKLNTLNLKYEKILSIYSSEEYEDSLEKIIKNIINKDGNCPKEILMKKIEIDLEKYKRKEKEKKISGIEYANQILVMMKKYIDKLDKNNLLMLFKLSAFEQGVVELNKIMALKQDILQISMDQHDYKKINELCRNSLKENQAKDKKVNFWLQALYYYIDISNNSNVNLISEYLIEVLDNLSKQEDFSPINLIDIIEGKINAKNKIIQIKVLKKFFKDWIVQKRDSLKEDKLETEENYKKILEYDKNIKEIQMSAKTCNSSRCSSCKSSLDMPYIYFVCGHAYHQNCLDENNGKYECPICKGKNNQFLKKIEEGENYAKEPEKYLEDLNNKDQRNKFDVFADYIRKGIFIESKDENSGETLS